MNKENEIEQLRARVEELESQAAFAEDLNVTLSDTIARQDREIRALAKRLANIEGRITEISSVLPEQEDEVPPHY